MSTAKEMIAERLQADGFDGLYNKAQGCSCTIARGLAYCGCIPVGCLPGYEYTCSCNFGNGKHVGPDKPIAKDAKEETK